MLTRDENVNSVSVVIPTYNRGDALGLVLDRLLLSDRNGLGEVEIVVVDDGSSIPAAPIVNTRQAPRGFTLKCVRQENAGPAAARNLGFTSSRGDIVIFIDDDILVPSELIRKHIEAHGVNPGAVIFGTCVPPVPSRNHIGRVLEAIYGSWRNNSRFERVPIISSQHLSVERRDFPTGVYSSDLKTPAAEEFELSARCCQRGIPIFNATQLSAVHDQQLAVSDLCDQQYKHAMGCAEAVCKLPDELIMDELAKIGEANGPILGHDSFTTRLKKTVKGVMATRPMRRTLISLCGVTGRVIPSRRTTAKILLLAIGISFFAGYREGMRRFGART